MVLQFLKQEISEVSTNIFTLHDYRSVFLTFIRAPDEGLAESKHVVYWRNFKTNGRVCKQTHTAVCQAVFIVIVTEVTHRDDPSKS
jgi:hypothetical protein